MLAGYLLLYYQVIKKSKKDKIAVYLNLKKEEAQR
jgi:hypothetical protein